MNELDIIIKNSGILSESKYGQKFDQFKPPFKHNGKEIVDSSSKELCECKNADLAKELAAILNDLLKMREASEKISTLWR